MVEMVGLNQCYLNLIIRLSYFSNRIVSRNQSNPHASGWGIEDEDVLYTVYVVLRSR